MFIAMSQNQISSLGNIKLSDEGEIPSSVIEERWYILQAPICHRGPILGLDKVVNEYQNEKQSIFEVFRPKCIRMVLKNGKWEKESDNLYFNYVFIKADINELEKLRKNEFSILRFLRDGRAGYENEYAFIDRKQMSVLKWISQSYSQGIPIYYPKTENLKKGDRIRIIDGEFKGIEAIVEFQTGSGTKNVMVRLENWASIPLINVKCDQYEILELGGDNKRICSKIENSRLAAKLHESMMHLYENQLTEKDLEVAKKAIREYGRLQYALEYTCKVSSHLLQAYKILGKDEEENYQYTLSSATRFLKENVVNRMQQKAQLLIALYGCTNDFQFRNQAHQVMLAWGTESASATGYKVLLQRLKDYDRLFDKENSRKDLWK